MKNIKQYRKQLFIAVIIVGSIFFLYILFSSSADFESEGLVVNSDNPLLAIDAANRSEEIVQSEVFFLEQINRLQEVTFADIEILSSEEINVLVNNTVPIPDLESGRANPFLPIDARTKIETESKTRAFREAQEQQVIESESSNDSGQPESSQSQSSTTILPDSDNSQL